MLVAADTNILIDQALGDANVLDALATIKERLPQANLVVTQTVLIELAWAADYDDDPKVRKAAAMALGSLRNWGYQPMDMVPVDRGIVEQVSEHLRSAGILPEEEENDASIICEAAMCNCTILLSSDGHLHAAQQHPNFRRILKEAHVDGDGLVIGRPATIAKVFSIRR